MTWGINDYPAAGAACGLPNLCGGFATRNCTDFCAWRLTHDLGVPCSRIAGLGDALTWAARAAARGIPVDGNVQLHDVFMLPPGVAGAGSVGHVGMVLQVLGGGRFVAEQYNWGVPEPCCCYTNNVVLNPDSRIRFIHFAGVAPPPGCGAGCPPTQVCANGVCVCPAGTNWNGSVCAPPPPPPAGGGGGSSAALLLLAAGLGGLAWYEVGYKHRTWAELRAEVTHGRGDAFAVTAQGRRHARAMARVGGGFVE